MLNYWCIASLVSHTSPKHKNNDNRTGAKTDEREKSEKNMFEFFLKWSIHHYLHSVIYAHFPLHTANDVYSSCPAPVGHKFVGRLLHASDTVAAVIGADG